MYYLSEKFRDRLISHEILTRKFYAGHGLCCLWGTNWVLFLCNSDAYHFNTTLLTAHLFQENVWAQSVNLQSGSKFCDPHRNKYRAFMNLTASFVSSSYSSSSSSSSSSSPTQFSKFVAVCLDGTASTQTSQRCQNLNKIQPTRYKMINI